MQLTYGHFLKADEKDQGRDDRRRGIQPFRGDVDLIKVLERRERRVRGPRAQSILLKVFINSQEIGFTQLTKMERLENVRK